MKNFLKKAIACMSVVLFALALNITAAYADELVPVEFTDGTYTLNKFSDFSSKNSDLEIDNLIINTKATGDLRIASNQGYIKFKVDRTVNLSITITSNDAKITTDDGKIYNNTTGEGDAVTTLTLSVGSHTIRLTEGSYTINGNTTSNAKVTAFSLSVALADSDSNGIVVKNGFVYAVAEITDLTPATITLKVDNWSSEDISTVYTKVNGVDGSPVKAENSGTYYIGVQIHGVPGSSAISGRTVSYQ